MNFCNLFLKPLCLFIAVSGIATIANGQGFYDINKKDTLKIYELKEVNFNFKLDTADLAQVDTSLYHFNHFLDQNKSKNLTAQFANVGLAMAELVYDQSYSDEFLPSQKYFHRYILNMQNAGYYIANRAYTNLFFSMGPNKEQQFNLDFTRNFTRNLNVAIRYKLLHSLGVYQQQKSDDNFLQLTSNYSSKNEVYKAIAGYFYNRIRVQENGGIKNDSDFTQNLEHNRQLIDVNLSTSSSALNKIKESGFYFKQFVIPGRKVYADTSLKVYKYHGLGQFSYCFYYKNQSEVYSDNFPLSGFYAQCFLDTSNTLDSAHVNIIENSLSWSNLNYNNTHQDLYLRAGIRHRASEIAGLGYGTMLNSLIPEATVNIRFGKNFHLNVEGFYYANGYRKGDQSASAEVYYSFNKKSLSMGYVGFLLNEFKQTPSIYELFYTSNNFFWVNNFTAIFGRKASLYTKIRSVYLSLTYYQHDNRIYYNALAMPEQYPGTIDVFQIKLKKDVKLGNWHLDNQLYYQSSTKPELIRFPKFITNNMLYYEDDLFKKALKAQFGLEFTLSTSYKPMAWMPATREFYLQDTYQTANYPYCDFFINVKIKRANIFLKIDHFNSGLSGYDYYSIPHYPMQDRAFRFGVSWTFYQ